MDITKLSQLCDPLNVTVPRDRNKATSKGGELGWEAAVAIGSLTQAHSPDRTDQTRISD